MNKAHHIFRFAAISFLVNTLPTATYVAAQEKVAPAQEQSELAGDLLGTWVYVGEPGHAGETPASGGRLKFITGRHWTNTQADRDTGLTIYHHGGTYILHGNEYVETVEYANESTRELIKKTFKFAVTVEGDTLTMIGIGNPWKEVRKRLR